MMSNLPPRQPYNPYNIRCLCCNELLELSQEEDYKALIGKDIIRLCYKCCKAVLFVRENCVDK